MTDATGATVGERVVLDAVALTSSGSIGREVVGEPAPAFALSTSTVVILSVFAVLAAIITKYRRPK